MKIKGLLMQVSLIIIFSILGQGCAAKKMAVENADFLLSHQIDKRLSLYTDQKSALNKDIDSFLNQLKPDAKNLLSYIDEIDLTENNQTAKHYERLETFFKTITRKFTDLVSKYMAKLDAKQQKEFFQKLDDENSKIAKTNKDGSAEIIEKRIKFVFGSITSAQKQLIDESIKYFEGRSRERLERRVELHQTFRSIYSQDISEEAKARLFQEAFKDYQEKSYSSSKNRELLKSLVPTITEKQRKHFQMEAKEIKSLLQHFLSLNY